MYLDWTLDGVPGCLEETICRTSIPPSRPLHLSSISTLFLPPLRSLFPPFSPSFSSCPYLQLYIYYHTFSIEGLIACFTQGRIIIMSAPSDPPSSASSRGTRVHHRILAELGLTSVWQSPRDVKLLCAQRFVRLFAYGGSTLILAAYLSALDISDERIGLFMTLTLVGDVAISFLLTLFADAMGRRAVLALGSALMVGSGILFASVGNYWVLLAAAVFGVISPR